MPNKRSDFRKIRLGLEKAKSAAECAQYAVKIRDSLGAVESKLTQFVGMCEAMQVPEQNEAIVCQLAKIYEELKSRASLERDDIAGFRDEIAERIFRMARLTQTAGKEVVEMTDECKIDALCKLGRTISTMAKDRFLIESGEYVHIDEIKSRIYRIYIMTMRYLISEADQVAWLSEFEEIFGEMETAKASAP